MATCKSYGRWAEASGANTLTVIMRGFWPAGLQMPGYERGLLMSLSNLPSKPFLYLSCEYGAAEVGIAV
jgi:hypothetical protein